VSDVGSVSAGGTDLPPAALVVDAVGLRCPMPVLELARRVAAAGLPDGSEVEVVSDDPAAAADVPAWAQMRGHAYVGSTAVGAVAADPVPGASDGGPVRYRIRLGG
jgi:TusA-related sulfurtransferase